MSLLPRRTETFRVLASGAREQASRAREVSREIDAGMQASARNVGSDAELIFQAHAPKRTGRLARGIRAIPAGDTIVVSATAVDPKSAFDYVGVTRFGHQKRFIVPVSKSGRARKSRTVLRTSTGQFSTRSAAKLVFTSRGRLWRLSRVRGFRPKGDWVDRAIPEIQVIADTEMEKTGNRITAVWRG